MPRTLLQVDTDLAALQARVNAIDGIGLADPTQGNLAGLQKQITGLKTTLNQVALAIQGKIKSVCDQVTALQTLLQQRFNGQ